jgi:hypothetical protein
MSIPPSPSRSKAVVRLLLMAALLGLASAASAGAPIGPGPITLPPIVAKYDEHCLDRIDRKDEKLAARQSRECRKPRGSRNALPMAGNSEPIKPQ